MGFLPNTGFSFVLESIMEPEYGFWKPTLGMCSGSVLFIILYFYFDAILPNEYGIKKQCCFCFNICKKKKANQT